MSADAVSEATSGAPASPGSHKSFLKPNNIESAATWLKKTEPMDHAGDTKSRSIPSGGLPFGENIISLPRRIVFTPQADATIMADPSTGVTGNGKINGADDSVVYTFDVSIPCLTGAMPVWRKIAQDPALEHGSDGKLRLKLDSDDDAEAFVCLLNIAHWNFDQIPLTPTVELLYNMSVLANKYGCERLLMMPIHGEWMRALRITAKHAAGPLAVQLAWIGHVLKDLDVEAAGLKQLVFSSRPGDGDLGIPTTKGRITELRQEAVSKILGRLDNRLEALRLRILSRHDGDSHNADTYRFCHATNPSEVLSCEAAMFGSAVAALTDAGLHPAKDHRFPGTVNELSEKLSGLKLVKYTEGDMPPHACRHLSCGLGLDLSVDVCF